MMFHFPSPSPLSGTLEHGKVQLGGRGDRTSRRPVYSFLPLTPQTHIDDHLAFATADQSSSPRQTTLVLLMISCMALLSALKAHITKPR